MTFKSLFRSNSRCPSKNDTLLLPMTSSAILLPEILSIIFSFLSQRTLSHSAQYVCRQWLTVARPMIQLIMLWEFKSTSKSNHDLLLARLHLVNELRIVFDEQDDSPETVQICKILSAKFDSLAFKNQLRISKLSLVGLSSLSNMMYLILPQQTLTEIHIIWKVSNTVCLSMLLTLCPYLLRLYIEGCSDQSQFAEDFTAFCPSATTRPKESGIECLIAKGVCIQQNRLEAILGRCPRLEILKLVNIIKSKLPGSSLNRSKLLSTLAISCPRLKCFHLSISGRHMISLDTAAWSRLYHHEPYTPAPTCSDQGDNEPIGYPTQSQQLFLDTISVLDRDINKSTLGSIFAPALNASLGNIITTLEIISSGDNTFYGGIGGALHTFLCSAPSLLHLLAPAVYYFAEYLDLYGPTLPSGYYHPRSCIPGRPVSTTHSIRKEIWACRGLRTLHIKFTSRDLTDHASAENAKIMFGYIAKVCPNLRELVIDRQALNLKRNGGLCLLSGLKCLQTLIVLTRTKTALEEKDINWMAHRLSLESSRKASDVLWRGLNYRIRSNLRLAKSNSVTPNYTNDSTSIGGTLANDLRVEDVENIGSSENLKECLRRLEQGVDGEGCWPQLELLCIDLCLVRKGKIVNSEDHLPIMVSGIRPGIEFSCSSTFWQLPSYRLQRAFLVN